VYSVPVTVFNVPIEGLIKTWQSHINDIEIKINDNNDDDDDDDV